MRIARRPFLAALTAVPMAACVPGTSKSPEPNESSADATTTAPNAGKVAATIFDGAFGTAYVKKAGEVLSGLDSSASVNITPAKDIAGVVKPLFTTGTPPDLVDNSGPKQLALASYTDKLEDLTSLVAGTNLEGVTIRDTLYAGVLEPGAHEDRLLGLNYALSVYGLWYSSSRLAADGIAVPAAWDTLLELGKDRKKGGTSLFAWSSDAANYYQELAISSAIKEGGHEVRRGIDNLTSDCWSHPAVTAVFEWLAKCVKAGLFQRHETYLKAQQAWVDGKALLYPCGAWLAKEMANTTKSGFEMSLAPAPTVTAAPTLPAAAVHATATEQFVVPKDAKNSEGAKQLLRVMLSKEVTEWFAQENLMPTVVRGAVPDNQPTALASQTRLLAAAGENVFSWRFDSYYGLTPSHNQLWTKFLAGETSPSDLAAGLQDVTNKAKEDPTMEHYTVE